VRVLDLPRVGKAGALAEGVRRASGEILLFTDANTEFRRDAVRALASNFADPDVGGVAGHTGYLVPEQGESSGRGEDLYWRYDTWLKTLQTRTGSVISAHGGIYAIRRELFRPVEDPAVTDDFAISTGVVAQGRRLVFEPAALGQERTMERSGTEFRRRVRLMTRGIQGVVLRRELLNPLRYGFYSVIFFSHKVLRRLLPLTLPVLLVSSTLLALRGAGPFYILAATAQGLVYVLALAGWALKGSRLGRRFFLYAPFFFCLANAAALLALWNVARGRRIERWSPHRHADGGQRADVTIVSGVGRPSGGVGAPALGAARNGDPR
jgi:cellulose synthase/poly-beta-1,6-N-acetylglucosamine synthase-like glycosyltransferase